MPCGSTSRPADEAQRAVRAAMSAAAGLELAVEDAVGTGGVVAAAERHDRDGRRPVARSSRSSGNDGRLQQSRRTTRRRGNSSRRAHRRVLSIPRWAWNRDTGDLPFGMSALQLRVEDLARIGMLSCEHGAWRGTQLFAKDWASAARSDLRTIRDADSRGRCSDRPNRRA